MPKTPLPLLLLLLQALLVVVALFLFVSPARAAEITVITEASLPRLDVSGNPLPKRTLTRNPEAINKTDCDADQKIRFPLTLVGFQPNATLEAWASVGGADCRSPTARSGATQQCWKVLSGIPLQSQPNVDVRVRDIIMGAPPFSASSLGGAPCGVVDEVEVAVHFLYFNPGDLTTPTVSKSIIVRADTVSPPAPTVLQAKPSAGESSIHVSWALQANVELVQVYCARIEADPNQACSLSPTFGPKPVFVTPQFDARFACASIVDNNVTATIVPASSTGAMQKGERYVFAIAALDAYENPSPLSTPACASVIAASEGNETEGCSTTGSSPTSTLFGVVVVFGLLLSLRRKRMTPRVPFF